MRRFFGVQVPMLFTLSLTPALPAETLGEARLTNGQVVPGWIQRVEGNGVVWKTRDGQVGTFPLSAVEEVVLLLPEELQTAIADLEETPSATSIALLETYADTNQPDSYHPVPGNLASRAQYELFRFHQRNGDAENAAQWAAQLDTDLLIRINLLAPIALYRELMSSPLQDFNATARSLLEETTSPNQKEIRYLIGVKLEMEGNPGAALTAYGEVYSPDFDLLDPFCGFALERTIRILETNPPKTVSEPRTLAGNLRGLLELFPGER